MRDVLVGSLGEKDVNKEFTAWFQKRTFMLNQFINICRII